jgi:hypothetical protein
VTKVPCMPLVALPQGRISCSGTNRIHLVLFGMQNRALGPYSAAIDKTLHFMRTWTAPMGIMKKRHSTANAAQMALLRNECSHSRHLAGNQTGSPHQNLLFNLIREFAPPGRESKCYPWRGGGRGRKAKP